MSNTSSPWQIPSENAEKTRPNAAEVYLHLIRKSFGDYVKVVNSSEPNDPKLPSAKVCLQAIDNSLDELSLIVCGNAKVDKKEEIPPKPIHPAYMEFVRENEHK